MVLQASNTQLLLWLVFLLEFHGQFFSVVLNDWPISMKCCEVFPSLERIVVKCWSSKFSYLKYTNAFRIRGDDQSSTRGQGNGSRHHGREQREKHHSDKFIVDASRMSCLGLTCGPLKVKSIYLGCLAPQRISMSYTATIEFGKLEANWTDEKCNVCSNELRSILFKCLTWIMTSMSTNNCSWSIYLPFRTTSSKVFFIDDGSTTAFRIK